MSRSTRAEIARDTVAILESGLYVGANDEPVTIAEMLAECRRQTQLLQPTDLRQLLELIPARPAAQLPTRFEVVNETTLAGIARLMADRAVPVAVLNFASAKNPGGGFLGGSQAQEESLARSSGLFASQQQAAAFYQYHRKNSSLLYSDHMIWSPDCPVFKNDDGVLLERPHLVNFITSAAPNAGALQERSPEQLAQLPATLQQRAEYVLALAAAKGMRNIVLGAWGCGVFRNDPKLVAATFEKLFSDQKWRGRFDRVVFSVFDSSSSLSTFSAFKAMLPRLQTG